MSHDAQPVADGIAVVGMSGRFPGASSVEALWENLRHGVESITTFTIAELEAAGVPPEVYRQEGYVPAAGLLDAIDMFDARCFGFSPRDAEMLDPQQRLFLESAWEVLERAGCNADDFPGLIGVYAGTSLSLYAQHNLYHKTGAGGLDDFQVFLGNDKDHLATRTAYKLNLRGPAVTVQTACSTSLVAVCMACDSLQALQCDLALAGGVTIRVPQIQGYVYKEGGIGSPDGHCRSFDAAAEGTVGSSGVALVALKRLSDALEQGDHIHAIIRGWALNNDGSSKVGYTAPSVSGQADVVAAALALAGVGPESISYVEAHGTATPIGDPIEIAALTRAFSRKLLPRRSCAIGSLKSNLGHLDSAAGAAALIKTSLALEHRVIPPSLHFTSPNPEIDFDAGPFFVNDRARDWTTTALPRRAGVSSFGIGGTNAHVIVEEPPTPAMSDPPASAALFVLSANTGSALDAVSTALAIHLTRNPDLNIADVASTLQIGRKALPHRRAFVCADVGDAIDCLIRREPSRVHDRVVEGGGRTVAFMFPGQGAQHVDMARELYRTCPEFAQDVNRATEQLRGELGLDLRQVMFPDGADRRGAELRLQSTALAQPALFVIEYAMAKTWMRWGVVPTALIGHSLGEYVAACVAGVFTFEDALRLVTIRGRLMEMMPVGAMTAVPLAAADVEPFLDDGIGVAAMNGSRLTVVSGPRDSVDRLERRLTEHNIAAQRLNTSRAFHSAMMDPILESFADEVRRVRPRAPHLPVISNVTGGWLTDAQATDPRHWARHAREPVRFYEGLRTLRDGPSRTLLEMGPGRTLTSLARLTPSLSGRETLLASLPASDSQRSLGEHLADSLGSLWLDGVPLDWRAVHAGERRNRVVLPTYPFERQRYWIDSAPPARVQENGVLERLEISDWFSVPSWTRKPPAAPLEDAATAASPWLILSDRSGVGEAVGQRLHERGAHARVVFEDDAMASMQAASTRVHEREFYNEILAEIDPTGDRPPRIVHLWGLTAPDAEPSAERSVLGGLYSVLGLAQATVARYPGRPVRIDIVTDGISRVRGDEPIVPLKRATLAVAKGLPQEYAAVTCRTIELDWRGKSESDDKGIVDQIFADLHEVSGPSHVAYRGVHRWAPSFERIALSPRDGQRRLREGGVYLITGGLGQIGLTVAHHLASKYGARLALVGRSALPDRAEWSRFSSNGDGDAVGARVRAVMSIEDAGGEVLLLRADTANPDDVRSMLDATRAHFGALHGVIHGAGLTTADGFAGLNDLDIELCERQLAGKAGGTLILAELLREEALDFVVLFSSLSSVLVGLGFIPYAAANLVLDAVAERESARGRTPWISVNWDGWDFTGGPTSADAIVILPEEGCDALDRILAAPQPQIVVSTADLDLRVRQWVDIAAQRVNPPRAEADAAPGHERPDLSNPFVEPQTDLERTIAELWQSLLGLARVGADDNFFELGGHSLLAIQLTARMREVFQVDVPVRALFDAPTVSALAAFIGGGHARADADAARIVRVLDRVERLSDEEMQALLAAQQPPSQAVQ